MSLSPLSLVKNGVSDSRNDNNRYKKRTTKRIECANDGFAYTVNCSACSKKGSTSNKNRLGSAKGGIDYVL